MGKIMCFECGQIDNYEMRKITRKYEGDGYCFELDVEVPFCKECGEKLVWEELEEQIAQRANALIRKQRDIITKGEIIEILDRYNTSQKFLSKLLGWGDITLTRYISGNYTPSKENSDKLKSLRNPYVFQKLLNDIYMETNGEIRKEKSFEKSQERVSWELQKREQESGKIFNVINWFLEQGSKEVPLTHLTLQKLLYFVQGWSKAINGEWMFEDECQKWGYGVIYPKVYELFKDFEYSPLPKVKIDVNLEANDLFILEMVKRYYYDVYNAKTLERICHLENSCKELQEGNGEEQKSKELISKERMKMYYCHLAQKYEVSNWNTSGVKAYLNHILY